MHYNREIFIISLVMIFYALIRYHNNPYGRAVLRSFVIITLATGLGSFIVMGNELSRRETIKFFTVGLLTFTIAWWGTIWVLRQFKKRQSR